jgi:hypothetical protein
MDEVRGMLNLTGRLQRWRHREGGVNGGSKSSDGGGAPGGRTWIRGKGGAVARAMPEKNKGRVE